MLNINLALNNLKFIIKRKSCLVRLMHEDLNLNLYKLNTRENTFLLSNKRYENHQHVLYSSFLELQEHMGYILKRSSKNQIKNLKSDRHRYKQYAFHDPESPKNWMDDYEYYSAADKDGVSLSEQNGSADLIVIPSNVPCNGCGAFLQCNYAKSPGFLPSEIFKGRTEKELKTVVCKRCHFLKNYNQALDLEVTAESYIKTICSIEDKFALAVIIVDLLDFPCSIWPEMCKILGPKRPVFVVGNKVDLLPRDCNSYLNHIKECLKEEILKKSGFDKLNIKNVSLISAKTGYGIEELITQLHKIWAYKGDVYLLGCTNVGKSSLFNILLNSDYCRPESAELIRKATISPWPGTTLQMLKFPIHRPSAIRVYERFKRLMSENFIKAEKVKIRVETARRTGNINDAMPVGTVGRTFSRVKNDVNDNFVMSKGVQPVTTFNEKSKEYQMARWVYDTPGVLHPDQITDLLTAQELMELQPKKMISPRAYRLEPGMSLFVAGLSRLDFIKSDSNHLNWIKIFLFASFDLPTIIVETDYAEDIYNKYLNTPMMKIPTGNAERFSKWPGLQCHPKDLIVKGLGLKTSSKETTCSADIILSSVGWVGLYLPLDVNCVFRAWTPNARGVHLRTLSLVPYAERLIGKRIRHSLAYNISKPFTFKK